MKPLLVAKGITKCFGETKALDNIDFNLCAGEIHGLVGANGSGKSTLLNILCGNQVIAETGGYEGELFWNGLPLQIRNAAESRALGIGMVHQELALIGDLSVAANIKLGHEVALPWTERLFGKSLAYVDEKSTRHGVATVLSRLKMTINPAQLTSSLSVNLKQFVEVAREISRDLKVLILDEPTASLGPDDAKNLISVLQELKNEGMAIVLVSHRLEELTDCCDRITVFRDAKVQSEFKKADFDLDQIAQDMLGTQVSKVNRKHRELEENIVLELNDLSCGRAQQKATLSLKIYKGEVLGLTGLAGHGHNLLPYGLMGLVPCEGEAFLEGVKVKKGDANFWIQNRVFFLPDERKELGLLLEDSIENNITFTARHMWGKFTHRGWPLLKMLKLPNRHSIRVHSEGAIKNLSIKCRGPRQWVGELSGGNQQKVCVARAMALNPSILFVGEPTRGMDIRAKEIILDQLLDLNRHQGTTLVLASGELEELQRVCDRIVVFHEGRIHGVYGPETTTHTLLQAMIGKSGGTHEVL